MNSSSADISVRLADYLFQQFGTVQSAEKYGESGLDCVNATALAIVIRQFLDGPPTNQN